MKTLYRILVLLVFITTCQTSWSQTFEAIDNTPDPGDSTTFTYDLPVLGQFTAKEPPVPHYLHLFMYGDGQFDFATDPGKGQIKHAYGAAPIPEITRYYARSISTGVYSNNDEPPREGTDTIIPPAGSITTRQYVDNNRYLKILRNVEVLPGEPFVNIVAVRNPLDDNSPFTGQLLFLYNGRLRTVVGKTKEKNTLPASVVLPEFSNFTINENISYRPDLDNQEFNTSPSGPDNGRVNFYYFQPFGGPENGFQNIIYIDIDNLQPGEETYFYFEMVGDENMMDVFEATQSAELDFAAALLSPTLQTNNSPAYPVLTPDDLQSEVTLLKLEPFLVNNLSQEVAPQQVRYFQQQSDSTLSYANDLPYPRNFSPHVIDYAVSTATLVKSHDPNFILVETCACQPDGSTYPLQVTVQCENVGLKATDNIYIDVLLPDGLSAGDVTEDLLSFYPNNGGTPDIDFSIIDDETVRWSLNGFRIEGTPLYGAGDPRTFATIQLMINAPVGPETLGDFQACIRFDNDTATPVCTAPELPVYLGEVAVGATALNCMVGDCDGQTGGIDISDWPWWYWLLLIILLLFIIWWIASRRTP